jgi:hypothetical protein
MKNYWLDKIPAGKIGMQTDDRNYDKLLCNLSVEGEKELLKHLLNKYKNDEEVLNAVNFLQTTLEKKSTVTGTILTFPADAVHHHIPSTITIAGDTLGYNCYPCSSVSSSSYSGSPPLTASYSYCYSSSSSSSSGCGGCSSSSSSSSSSASYIVGGDAAIAADIIVEAKCPQDDMKGVADLIVLAQGDTNLTLWNDYQYVSNEECKMRVGYDAPSLALKHCVYRTKFKLGHTPVAKGTLTGTVYVGAEAIQTFVVSSQGVFNFEFVSPWTAENVPHSVEHGCLNLEKGEVYLDFDKRPEYTSSISSGELIPIKLVTSYEYKFNGEI